MLFQTLFWVGTISRNYSTISDFGNSQAQLRYMLPRRQMGLSLACIRVIASLLFFFLNMSGSSLYNVMKVSLGRLVVSKLPCSTDCLSIPTSDSSRGCKYHYKITVGSVKSTLQYNIIMYDTQRILASNYRSR